MMNFAKNTASTFVIFLTVTLIACDRPGRREAVDVKERKVQRFGSVTGLNPEKVTYYKQLHAETWPGVLRMIEACNIRNYSIYLHEIEGKPYLFSYYEYVGDNYEADMKKMAADSTTQRWWRETDPCQVPLPEATAGNKIWTNMEEVFHTD